MINYSYYHHLSGENRSGRSVRRSVDRSSIFHVQLKPLVGAAKRLSLTMHVKNYLMYLIGFSIVSFAVKHSSAGEGFIAKNIRRFLDAPSHLYKRVCPSVRPSVRPSVGPSRVIFRRVLGASCAVYPALFLNDNGQTDIRTD